MPVPAGTGMDRRSFLLRSAGAVLSVYGAAALSPRHFEDGIAEAAAAGAAEPAGAGVDLHGRRLGRAVGARPRAGSPLPRTAPDPRPQRRRRRRVQRGRNPDVAPERGGPRAAARRRQGHGVPGDRLRPAGREPLHQPPLLGGRRTEHADALGLDGPLPGHRRQRRQPPAGPVARLLPRARPGHHEEPRGGRLLALGLQLLGLRPGRTDRLLGARHVRRARRARRSLAGLRPGAGGRAGHRDHPRPDRPVR